ncbi:MAG: 3'(2'),5'-bisphosphate nucleotidase CysQ [Mediterranea sp.]|nr:3'(2'),5'-bisphosphate nucleotidase CysQ [Mediterranea sp.]
MAHKYLDAAIEAAKEAGEAIRKIYEDPASDFEIEKKADNSPLTVADRRANDIIQAILRERMPYPVLSEEGAHVDYATRRTWDTLWIVDPLDGTKEFIKRNGEFTVNIALVQNTIPVLGVIYIPTSRELYFAAEGVGAYKGPKRLPLKQERDTFVVVASRSHLNAETEAYIDELKKTHTRVEVARGGSSIKICLVAEGAADVYPRFAPTMEWDTAAGHAIARMAGREIYQADTGEPLRYNKENLLNPWFVVK